MDWLAWGKLAGHALWLHCHRQDLLIRYLIYFVARRKIYQSRSCKIVPYVLRLDDGGHLKNVSQTFTQTPNWITNVKPINCQPNYSQYDLPFGYIVVSNSIACQTEQKLNNDLQSKFIPPTML